jgi:hypothetical protein
MADFALRLAFFSLAPIAIVFAAELFPVRGALIDVGLALGVFVASEVVQRWSSKVKLLKALLRDALAFETYYRNRPPRTFLYYLAYPLLFPYWIINRDARREFLIFRSYTLGGLLILIASLIWQYFSYWAPELTLKQYLPYVVLSLSVEMVLVLALLMPIATTVVWYHSSFRRGRLLMVLSAALLATSFAMVRVASRRAPLVSYAARERVALRTAASRRKAHQALLASARAAYKTIEPKDDVEGDGNVTGDPLDSAHDALESYYKNDEANAFSLWASPRSRPKVLVLYFEARRQRSPIYVAIRNDGSEIRSPSQLPKGAFKAMKVISEADDDWLSMWPEMIDVSDDETPAAGAKHGSTGARKAASPSPSSTRANKLHAPDASIGGVQVGDAGR